MNLTFLKLFQPQFLPAASGLIYAVPSSPTSNLLRNGRVRLTNITASAVAATLYAVPNDGSALPVNEFFAGTNVAANSYTDVDVPQLAYGDAVYGFAGTASAINVQAMDGVLIS